MTPDVITIEELPEYFAGVGEDWEKLNYQKFLNDELPRIAFLHAGYFADEAGPDGVAWRKLSPRTRKRVGIEGPDTILVDAGPLKESLTTDSGGEAIRIVEQTAEGWGLQFGTYDEKSSFHDDESHGYNPPIGSGILPYRPHVGLTDEYLDEATERAADHAVAEMVDVAA